MQADKVLLNGKIYSVGKDNHITRAEAVAISEGLFAAVGREDEIQAYIGEGTQIIDCKGNTVLPGLCDSHCHPSLTTSTTAGCDLFNLYMEKGETCQQMIDRYMERLKAYVTSSGKDENLIRGTGWMLAHFNGTAGENRMPTRRDIDKICADRPVILESFCQHNLWVNTKALEIAGIDENTPQPLTGKIFREDNGYPTGVFQEIEAMSLIKEHIPGYDFSVEKYKEAVRHYQKELANKYGITLVNDALHSNNAREAYRQMALAGELTIRMRGVYPLDTKTAQAQMQEIIKTKGNCNVNDLFAINTIKIFVEGEPTVCEPYSPGFIEVMGYPEEYCGNLFWEDEGLTRYMELAIKENLQIHLHAMGDRAVKQSVDCLLKAQNLAKQPQRNIIAHLMLVKEEDVKRISQGEIICACQPRWMVYDTDVEDGYLPYFGRERALQVFPNKTLVNAGCLVSYGTDFPVTPPPNPYHEIQCALTRTVFPDAPDYARFKGRILAKEERVSLKEAIRSLTYNGAYQNFLEEITGSIEVGKSADLVILDCDIEAAPMEELYRIQAEKTIFKGKLVYEAY